MATSLNLAFQPVRQQSYYGQTQTQTNLGSNSMSVSGSLAAPFVPSTGPMGGATQSPGAITNVTTSMPAAVGSAPTIDQNSNNVRGLSALLTALTANGDGFCDRTFNRKDAPGTNGYGSVPFDIEADLTSLYRWQAMVCVPRLAIVVMAWVQWQISDGFIPLIGWLCIFGGWMLVELLFMWATYSISSGPSKVPGLVRKENSWIISRMQSVAILNFLFVAILFANTLNQFLVNRNEAGFDFFVPAPNGVGDSSNNAWNQGISALGVPSNVYLSTQMVVILAITVVGGLYCIHNVISTLLRGRHPIPIERCL